MSDEKMLRAKAREAILTGRLPSRAPDRMWGGPGTGASCVICNEPVKLDDLGFELEFDDESGSRSEDEYHAHLRCFTAWDNERQRTNGHHPERSGQGTNSPVFEFYAGYSDNGISVRNSVDGVLDAGSEGGITALNEGTAFDRERDARNRRESE